MLLSKKFLHELMQLCIKDFGAQLSVYDAYRLYSFIERTEHNLNTVENISKNLKVSESHYSPTDWQITFEISNYLMTEFVTATAYARGQYNEDIQIVITTLICAKREKHRFFYNGSYFKIRKQLSNNFEGVFLYDNVRR